MNTRTLAILEYDKIREMLRPYAASSPGKTLVERMRPARDVAVVQSRLAETTEARGMLAERGDVPLGGFRDVRDAVIRAEKHGVLSPQELLEVADTASASRRLHRYLQRDPLVFPLLTAQGALLGTFTGIEAVIDRAIAANGDVVDGASPELERARRRVRALNDDIQRELQRIITTPGLQEVLQDPIVTQRNGRFCVPVRAEERNTFKGIVHDLSASGQTAFMEPLSVVELGNDLREAQRLEEAEVYRVLAELSERVGRDADRLLASIDAGARLDLIFARAACGRAMDAVEPVLNAQGAIDLIQARHPLLGEHAVPIDVRLGDDGDTTLLITGPNTGGKTVTLKTVGLLTLMAQSGLHIPAAEGSRLAIMDQVFVDIGDEQSIEQNLSTFSGHMTNIIQILKEAGARTLVLLDEIGAGTDPAEGAALGKSVLLELQERGCRTIATTHYGELKVFGQSTPGFLNASVEFDPETLRPTYRLITGLPGSSNAITIAQRLGLPKTVAARAKSLMGETPLAFEQVLRQAEGARRALDRERSGATRARMEAEATARHLQDELRTTEAKREEILARARKQAQDVLQKARLEANGLLDELRTALRTAREQGGANVADLRKRTRAVLEGMAEDVGALPELPVTPTRQEKPALTAVQTGQAVYVRTLGHRGTALEDGQGDDEVEVLVGIMRVRARVHDLEGVVQTSPSYTPQAARASLAKAKGASPEILLLGKRAEEAATELDEYLYTAVESGITRVRIVHGFGTGALRNVVRDVLRHHATVRSYRPGAADEGGGGVTVAELSAP